MSKIECPICDSPLTSLLEEGRMREGHQYECDKCLRKYSITQIKQVITASLRGKSREEVRGIILRNEDKTQSDLG